MLTEGERILAGLAALLMLLCIFVGFAFNSIGVRDENLRIQKAWCLSEGGQLKNGLCLVDKVDTPFPAFIVERKDE